MLERNHVRPFRKIQGDSKGAAVPGGGGWQAGWFALGKRYRKVTGERRGPEWGSGDGGACRQDQLRILPPRVSPEHSPERGPHVGCGEGWCFHGGGWGKVGALEEVGGRTPGTGAEGRRSFSVPLFSPLLIHLHPFLSSFSLELVLSPLLPSFSLFHLSSPSLLPPDTLLSFLLPLFAQ